MQFQCDRCGKRYSTAQEIRAGKSYRFRCRACSHDVIVRGPPAVPAAPLPAPATEAPPEGGYFDFRLDDDVVTSQSSMALPVPTRPARAVPDEFTPGLGVALPLPEEPPAPEPVEPAPRKRSGALPVAAVILVPAILGGVVAGFLLQPSPARKDRPAAGETAPGLLRPVVYVGPVAFEQREAPVPAASAPPPGARAPARREPPKPLPPRRTAAAQPQAAPLPSPAEVPPPAPAMAPPPAPALAAPAPAQAAPAPAATPPAAASAGDGAEETSAPDEPMYAREGFRRPAPETPRCVESGIRLPRELAGRLPPSVTLRFAVGRDGEADLVQALGEGVEPRLAEALRHAVRACRFIPGTDASGKPTRLWVVMPLRFAQ